MIYSFNYDELLNPEWSKRPFSSIIIGNNNGYAALGYGEFGNGEWGRVSWNGERTNEWFITKPDNLTIACFGSN